MVYFYIKRPSQTSFFFFLNDPPPPESPPLPLPAPLPICAGVPPPHKGPSLQERVLLMLSGLLVTHLRTVDGIGRYRDDTFMLVMPDTASVQAVWALQRVREGVRQQQDRKSVV